MKNSELESIVETSGEWIEQRTGIKQRHIAAENETTADIGEKAARAALEEAGVSIADIDMIILATSTPNNTFPATAVEIRPELSRSGSIDAPDATARSDISAAEDPAFASLPDFSTH